MKCVYRCVAIMSIFLTMSSTFSIADDDAPIDPGKPIEFTEVVNVEGAQKDKLYSAALAWFGGTFKKAQNVIDVQDKEAGRIIGKASFPYNPVVFIGSAGIVGKVNYTVTIEVKDNKYRYRIDGFTHAGRYEGFGSFGLLTTASECPIEVRGPSPSGRRETWADLKQKAKREAEILIPTLKESMLRPTSKTDDW